MPNGKDPVHNSQRIQTGVRIEEGYLRILNAVADQSGMTLGRLVEDLVLHALGGTLPFTRKAYRKIAHLKQVFEVRYNVHDFTRFLDPQSKEDPIAANPQAGSQGDGKIVIRRKQAGILVDKNILKVLKALALFREETLSALLEEIISHALEGFPPFLADALDKIAALKEVYELECDPPPVCDWGREERLET